MHDAFSFSPPGGQYSAMTYSVKRPKSRLESNFPLIFNKARRSRAPSADLPT